MIVAHGVKNVRSARAVFCLRFCFQTLIKRLKRDLRMVFLPNTAQNIKAHTI